MAKAVKIKKDTKTNSIPEMTLDHMAMLYMSQYGEHVVKDRALADYRDGFKPVQRRIVWGMYKLGINAGGGTKKCAKITGDVMGNYHPHGNCLSGNTVVPLCNGTDVKIEDLLGKGKKWVWAFDEKTNSLVPALAHSWRIGQYATKEIKITLSNGEFIKCTDNHPFYILNKGWVKAKDLEAGEQILGGCKIKKDYSEIRLNTGFSGHLHRIAGEKSCGKARQGYVYHHKNENTQDNRPNNFELMSREDHALHHENYLIGLEKGRDSMFGDSPIREATREKNKILAKNISKNYGLYIAIKGLRHLKERGVKLSKKNYIRLQDQQVIYNLTNLETLAKKGIAWKDLLRYYKEGVPNDTSSAKGLTKKIGKNIKKGRTYKVSGKLLHCISKALKGLKELTWSEYKRSIDTKDYAYNYPMWRDPKKIKKRLKVATVSDLCKLMPSNKFLSITKIETRTVKSKPMYDFTVDKYENMVVYTSNGVKTGNIIVAHNSAIYGALANMCGDSDINCPHNINTSVPLALGQGGLGYINSRPSDERYTEAKLSYFSEKCFLNKDYLNVTDMALSYDGENKEPVILPALLPNILLNGTAGIAVGVTGFIPPFEYKGVTKLVYKALQGKKITPKDCLDSLTFNFKYGGKIEATDAELTEYYKTGEGTIKVYPNSERDGNVIYLLDATPYFAPEKVFGALMGDAGTKKGKKKKRPSVGIEEVIAVEDISDAAEPFKMKITLKRGLSIAEMKKAHEKIIKKISNTIPLRTNVVEQIDSEKTEFRKWNIPTLITKWVEWRVSLEKKKQAYILDKLKAEIAYNKLMHFACDHLDVIFKVLKDRKPEPDKRLAKALKISETDAKTILDRRARDLSALAKSDLEKIIKEKIAKAKEAKNWHKLPDKKVAIDLKEFGKNPGLLGIGIKQKRTK